MILRHIFVLMGPNDVQMALLSPSKIKLQWTKMITSFIVVIMIDIVLKNTCSFFTTTI